MADPAAQTGQSGRPQRARMRVRARRFTFANLTEPDMTRASWLSGEAPPRPRRSAPVLLPQEAVTVAPEPGPPPAVAEVMTARPAPRLAPPVDLASRLA